MTRDKLAIGDFCRTGSGGTPSRKKASRYFGGSIPWVKSGELREGVITKTEETITEHAVIESSAKLIPKGALLVAMYGATIGRVAKLGIEATSNQAVCHILPDESLADTQYMLHALQAQVPHWLERGVGGAQPNISQEIIKNTVIPLPPLEEQRRIAAILDKAGRLATACARLQATHRRMGESLFIDAFGDPRSNPLDLPTAMLGEIADCQLGKMLDKKRESGSSQRPYLRNANIRWFEVDVSDLLFMDIEDHEMERFGVCAGDLLVCEGGEPGRAAIWRGDSEVFGFQKALHRIRPDKSRVLPEYLNWALWILAQRGLLGDHITSATIAHLTREKLLKIRVLLPPLSAQERFSRELGALDSLGLMARSRSNLIRSLNSSLFSALVATGIS